MEPVAFPLLDGILGVLAWTGIAGAALIIIGGALFVFDKLVDASVRSNERPWQPRLRSRSVPKKLADDLNAWKHKTDDELDLELADLRARAGERTGFGFESNTLPVYEAREIAGLPRWQIRQLLCLTAKDLATPADVERWQRFHNQVTRRLHKVALVINTRRELLLIAKGKAYVPEWMRPAEHTALELPESGPTVGTEYV